MSRNLTSRLTVATAAVISLTVQASASTDATQFNAQSLNQGRPLFFTENKGQWDERVLFKADGAGGLTWFIERDGFTVLFSVPDTTAGPIPDPRSIGLPDEMRRFDTVDRYPNKAHALKFKFQNVIPRATSNFLPEQTTSATASSIESTERLLWNNNYFLGNDESKWAPDCGNYQRVVLKDVWESVDVHWRGVGKAVEFDFVVTPGADASQIRVECLGLTGDLEETADGGELLLPTSLGVLRQALPEAYQVELDGTLSTVSAEFSIREGNAFGVALPEGHDSTKPLVVDPLVYSTYLGGSGDDVAYAISHDDAGGVIVAGSTRNNDFPLTEGAFDTNYGGNQDAFIARLNAEGNALIYSTYLGGSSGDGALALLPDGAGGVVVAGTTLSRYFPTTEGAYQRNFGGDNEAFIARLNAEGNALIYSTYLGGSIGEEAYALSTDDAGGVVVAGYTSSNDFPVTEGAYQMNRASDGDAFVTRLNAEGSALIYSTYLGGNSTEFAYTLCPDGGGGVVVAGYTYRGNFPTTDSAFQRNYGGGDSDAFIAHLNADGSALIYSTYLGGGGYDVINALSPDGAGGVIAAGGTSSNDFPTTEGVYKSNIGGRYDAFVTHLNAEGSGLIYSTFLGGSDYDVIYALTPDDAGGVLLAGYTASNDFPTTENAFQRNFGGENDAFISGLNAEGSALIYSTYLGGSNDDLTNALCPDSAGGVVVAGRTYSNDFPTTEGACDESFNGRSDVFITDIDIGLPFPVMLFGHVYDLADGTPIAEASVFTSPRDSVLTDQNGYWYFDRVRFGVFNLTASKAGYNDSTLTGLEIAAEETLEVDFSLRHPDFSISDDQLGAELPVGESIDIPFSISNQGNGPLVWSADKRLLGDGQGELGELRLSYNVTDSTGDDRIEGVVLAQDKFYISGSAGDQPSRIYVLDRDGSLVRSFSQFGDSRYGYKDLEWDGELIWGSGDDSVYAFDTSGELAHHWPGPFNPTNNIAWDSDRNLLYLAGTTTNITVCDVEGNIVGDQLNRRGLRMYGLSFWSDDPDGYPLYILHLPPDSQPTIHKMNPANGDTMFVAELPVPAGQSLTGLYITNQFDVYSWVMMTILNAPPADGGDCIQIYQLDARKDWFDLDVFEGELSAGETQDLILTLDATALPDTLFDAEIVFRHNADVDGFHLFISLQVISIPLPPPFSLLLPENGDTLTALPLQGDSLRMPPIEFIWGAVGAFDTVSYRFEIGLNDALVNFEVSDTSLALNLDTLGLPIGFGSRIEWNVVAQPRGEDEFPCIQPFHFFIMPNATDRREEPRPVEFGLSAPFPNPFNGSVILTYGIPEAGQMSLRVFDVTGREVATLASGSIAAGPHTTIWDAKLYNSGIYVIKLEASGFCVVHKVTLLR